MNRIVSFRNEELIFRAFLTIDAQGIQFDDISAKAVTMKSTGAITETDDTETDMIAETIHLEAAEINLDIAGNATLTANAQNNIDISAAGDLNASHIESTSGSIKIQADGNIEIGQISAKDRVTIVSNNSLAAADGQISGQSAVIKAEDGIGTENNLLSLSVDQLDIANTNTGNIYIQSDKALTLMDMDNDSLAVENTGRTITIDAAGIEQMDGYVKASRLNITSTDSVILTNNNNDIEILNASVSQGDISYTDANDIAIDRMTAQGNIILTAQSIVDNADDQTVDLTAGGEIILTAQKNITGVDTGDTYLELGASSTVTAHSDGMGHIHLQSSGDITLKDIATSDGEIHVNALGSIQAVKLLSGDMGNNNDFDTILTSGGTITVGEITTDHQLKLTAGNAIEGMASNSLSAQDAILIAKSGIGTSDTMLATDIAIIDVINTDTGNIYIHNGNDLILTDLNADGLAIQNSGGGKIVSAETLTIDTTIKLGDDFTLKGKAIDLSAKIIQDNQGEIRLEADDTLTFGIHTIQSADDGTFSLVTNMDIAIQERQIISGSGKIVIEGTGNLDIDSFDTSGELQIVSQTGEVAIGNIQAEKLVIDAHNIYDLNEDSLADFQNNIILDLHAADSILGLEISHEAQVTAIASKDIQLRGAGNITLDDIQAENLTIHAEGDMIARQLIATQNVNLQTEEDLFVGSIQAENDITLMAQKSSILDIEDGTIEGIHANGLVTMESYRDMANLSFSNDSQLNLKLLKAGDISIHGQGALTVQDIQTPDGKVDIVAGSHLIAESITATGQIYMQNTTGNIEVGRIQTPSEMTIQANDGKILEHGEDTDADIITSAWTKLQASSGIGGDQHLELDENCLVDASITGKGDIAIQSTGSINILSLKTTDGNMNILAENDIISDVILAGGDVIMQTPDGDIQVNQIQSSSNIRLLTEKGSIKDTSEDNTVALTGEGVMTLIASRNVNMRIADGSKIIARSTNEGSIHIQSPGDISIQSLETTDGDIYVKADGNIQALNMTTGDLGDNEPLVLSLSSKEKIYTGLIKADDYVYINADKIEHQLGSITAKQAVISAWNGIGTDDQSLRLNVNQLDASTRMSGDIYIHNLGDLELIDLTGQGQAVINAGGGEIRTDGQLTITDPLKQH